MQRSLVEYVKLIGNIVGLKADDIPNLIERVEIQLNKDGYIYVDDIYSIANEIEGCYTEPQLTQVFGWTFDDQNESSYVEFSTILKEET